MSTPANDYTQDNVFTAEISDELTIEQSFGVKFLAVENTTATAATITGTAKLGTRDSSPISLGENRSINIVSTDGSFLSGIVINATGTTAKVIAVI